MWMERWIGKTVEEMGMEGDKREEGEGKRLMAKQVIRILPRQHLDGRGGVLLRP